MTWFELAIISASSIFISMHSKAETLVTKETFAGRRITSIQIEMNGGRTSPHFIQDTLGLEEGELFDTAKWDEGVQRLWNLRCFSDVNATQVPDGDGVQLKLNLKEKWTTLPDLSFGGGGGTSYYRLGIYDINFFGRGVEGLAAYENMSGAHNGEVWTRIPQIFGSKFLVGTGFSLLKDVRTFYVGKRDVSGGETITKNTAFLELERNVKEGVRLGVRFENLAAKVGEDSLPSRARAENTKRQFQPQGKRNHLTAGLRLTLGGL